MVAVVVVVLVVVVVVVVVVVMVLALNCLVSQHARISTRGPALCARSSWN